jgi:hypothetical protein
LVWRWWPIANGVVLAAVLVIALAAALAGWARLPFAPLLKIASLEAMAVGLALAIVGKVLERLKLAPKTKSSAAETKELELGSPLLDPIPIVEPADPAMRAGELNEPDESWPLQTTTSAPPEPRPIPPEFAHGATAVWVTERSPHDNPPN